MSRKNWTTDKLFTRLLENKTKGTYWDTIRELRNRVNQEVFDKACKLANSSSDKEKIIGIDVLAQLGFNPRFNKTQTVQLYFELLNKEQSPIVLHSILSALGHNNEDLNKEQVSKLTEFKNHRYSDVRYGVVHALSGVENDLAILTMIELCEDKHSDIRDWATFSIGSQLEMNNETITNALWKRVDDEDENTRFEAIAGLSKRKDPRIKDILKEELKKIDDQGSLILESIEAFNDMDFVQLLEEQIKVNKKTKQVNEAWLHKSLQRLKTNLQQTI